MVGNTTLNAEDMTGTTTGQKRQRSKEAHPQLPKVS